VLFAWFGSEESGGYGAKYLLDKPLVPQSSIVANLEFEMIGRSDPAVASKVAKCGISVLDSPADIQTSVPITATYALTNATLPYVTSVADSGWKGALRADAALAAGGHRRAAGGSRSSRLPSSSRSAC